VKTGLDKLLWQPNLQIYFEMVLIVFLVIDEVKIYRKKFLWFMHEEKIIANLVKMWFKNG
jgi:hypothetical protein